MRQKLVDLFRNKCYVCSSRERQFSLRNIARNWSKLKIIKSKACLKVAKLNCEDKACLKVAKLTWVLKDC